MAKKIFVLDTNILLENPNCITEGFEDNDLVIPLPVLEEVDSKKHMSDTIGYFAREISRKVEECRQNSINIFTGVKRNEKGGLLRIVPIGSEAEELNKSPIKLDYIEGTLLRPGMDLTIIDNLIILTALKIKKENTQTETIVLSNDSNVRIKASMLGIKAQEYRDVKVDDKSMGYTGMQVIKLPLSFYGSMRNDGAGNMYWEANEKQDVIPISDFEEYNIQPNEFVLFDVLCNEGDDEIVTAKDIKKLKKIYRRIGDELVFRQLKNQKMFGGIVGKNLEQTCAIDLLLDDDVKVVSLKSQAGGGKTILSIAACLQKVIRDKQYEKIIFLKPTVSAHEDIGYLKGTMAEKLRPFLSSFIDNIDVLRKNENQNNKCSTDDFEKLIEKKIIEIEHIGFIRGRSFNNCLIIADEMQNVGRPVMKTIMSRVGENCKIICLGDIDQIDPPYLSKENNGISHLVKKFAGQTFYGHITLSRCERSVVSMTAAKLL
jgi:PhoH-like ATPase